MYCFKMYELKQTRKTKKKKEGASQCVPRTVAASRKSSKLRRRVVKASRMSLKLLFHTFYEFSKVSIVYIKAYG